MQRMIHRLTIVGPRVCCVETLRASDYAYFAPRFIALAHRGGVTPEASAAVENSLRAFDAAVGLGYRYLETDVHATSDQVLIAFHDDRLARVTDSRGTVADLTWAEVSSARIGGREPIPRLSDLLDALPHAFFNLDLKSDAAVEPLVGLLERRNATQRVCVGSFSTHRIRRFRTLTGGRIATSASPAEVLSFALAPRLSRIWPLAGQAFQVPERDPASHLRVVSRPMIEAAHRRGAHVHVWTVNDEADMERLIDMGVDGIVSDEIDTLKSVLTRRGLWEDTA